MKRILHLTLKRKWFDLIASGAKKIEYRDYKPYWIKRLLGKTYDEIHFRNGYSRNAPFMRVKYRGHKVVEPRSHTPANGEVLTGMTFALMLGDVLEIRI